jgi:hypothetical protein
LKRSSLRQRFKRALAVTVAVLFVVAAPLARAADPRVVLVVGTRDSANGQGRSGAEAHIRAELLADGLDVIILVEYAPLDPSTLQSVTVRTHSIAAISVSQQGEVARAQIWLSAGPDREAQLSQIDAEGESDERERLLALRVADFLYASLIELEPYKRRREQAAEAQAEGGHSSSGAAATPAKPPKKERASRPPPAGARLRQAQAPSQPPRSFPRAAVGIGGTFWAGFGTGGPELAGLGHTVAPTLTGGWWLARRWRIGGILSGPAVSFVDAPEGSAWVDQELLAAELQFAVHEAEAWMISAAVAGGAYRMGTNGDATPPYVTTSDAKVRAFAMVGAGGRLALQQNLWLVVRFDSVLVTQPLVLRMARDPKAHTALPLLLGSLGFEVTW